jgi:nitrite reductase/ring-hydroxylating ferredoxin subunit
VLQMPAADPATGGSGRRSTRRTACESSSEEDALTTFKAQAGLANGPDSIADGPDSTDRKSMSLQEARQLQDAPPPYPFGWFVVALRRELGKGEILTRQFMDREIVIYRTESGVVCAAEAYCPHLGAHLGHGGKVLGEELRCPLHRFRFSVNGSCVYSPTGAPPPAARLGLLEVREIQGAIFVWHGPAGQVPWEIEPLGGDDSDWHDLGHSIRRVHNHPQELAENSIDITHLSALHEFGNVQAVGPPVFDGPRLRARYTLTQPTPWKSGVKVEMLIRVDGLGFAVNEVEVGSWSLPFCQRTQTGPKPSRQSDMAFYRKSSGRTNHPARNGWPGQAGRVDMELQEVSPPSGNC